jgi:hypothetical protein
VRVWLTPQEQEKLSGRWRLASDVAGQTRRARMLEYSGVYFGNPFTKAVGGKVLLIIARFSKIISFS